MNIEIDFSKIINWDSFHAEFSKLMGFPDFYGNNMDAWIDCMSYIDDRNAGMSKVNVNSGESLNIIILGTSEAIENCPEIFNDFLECTSFVNQRFIETKSNTRIKIIAT